VCAAVLLKRIGSYQRSLSGGRIT